MRRYFPATLYYVACRETQLFLTVRTWIEYLLLNVKHDSKSFIINANHIYVAESYALGSAVAVDGYMVIEEEPAVLDAQIGFTVEDLKRDGGCQGFKKGECFTSFMIAMRISAGMVGALASTVAESLFHEWQWF
nr:hypothetical protein [Tanacetum cinerariifolium]